jgi:hypothetical protein
MPLPFATQANTTPIGIAINEVRTPSETVRQQIARSLSSRKKNSAAKSPIETKHQIPKAWFWLGAGFMEIVWLCSSSIRKS